MFDFISFYAPTQPTLWNNSLLIGWDVKDGLLATTIMVVTKLVGWFDYL